ncbi:hypothetical protein [Microvirga antarctica]|uniref:hypothetical protein n=1 Tax=Microvirga antarctica TaxID=2819233 RepID=UPI001B308532|nr:hypothetical protein [Microvirga antarctica]
MAKIPTAPSQRASHDPQAVEANEGSAVRGPTGPMETARFVADFTLELSGMARQSRLDLLAYLLDMARLEAIRVVQSNPTDR